jgi:hypothetical protein
MEGDMNAKHAVSNSVFSKSSSEKLLDLFDIN